MPYNKFCELLSPKGENQYYEQTVLRSIYIVTRNHDSLLEISMKKRNQLPGKSRFPDCTCCNVSEMLRLDRLGSQVLIWPFGYVELYNWLLSNNYMEIASLVGFGTKFLLSYLKGIYGNIAIFQGQLVEMYQISWVSDSGRSFNPFTT